MSDLLEIKDYCIGCGDPVYDGEFVVYVSEEAEDELSELVPYHEECQPYWSQEVDRYG